MSTSTGDDAVNDQSRLTVEDAGSTTDPADLTDDADGGERRNIGSLADDDGSIGHVFDQTNGVVEGLDGDSDGSADSDIRSASERSDENRDLFHDADVEGDGEAEDSRRLGA